MNVFIKWFSKSELNIEDGPPTLGQCWIVSILEFIDQVHVFMPCKLKYLVPQEVDLWRCTIWERSVSNHGNLIGRTFEHGDTPRPLIRNVHRHLLCLQKPHACSACLCSCLCVEVFSEDLEKNKSGLKYSASVSSVQGADPSSRCPQRQLARPDRRALERGTKSVL